MGALLEARNVSKVYTSTDVAVPVLKDVDFALQINEAVCIMGRSGAGKSTLLHILGTLDAPTEGKVYYKEEDITKWDDTQLSRFRNVKMGFVFQFHHLLSEFTALENVMLPGQIAGLSLETCESKAKSLLSELGLSHRLSHWPAHLSGGEQQRVAIARALICEPEVLFADEPTGNLDSKNALALQELLFELLEDKGFSLLTVTHDQAFAKRFTRVLTLRDGRF
ncbi:MAG: lipoprotein-releasing system ATP-binding protein LolD [Bdellovibrionales bacterium CG10_big_fil_rev_8_21_14_0_10_45_34]|nr:MAG: lipoprotein-releasing system ATP-binding protein LolD [Bdellovibrionales bacterium CG10_big_fil_rev_8_21_14_0_10_45_34]